MNVVLVDELVKALASLCEEANSINCLETGPEFAVNAWEVHPRVKTTNVGLVIEAFSALLSEGRGVSGVELETYRTPYYAEDVMGGSSQGLIQVFFGTADRTYHITIRQQSVHAQGGTPYGSQ